MLREFMNHKFMIEILTHTTWLFAVANCNFQPHQAGLTHAVQRSLMRESNIHFDLPTEI